MTDPDRRILIVDDHRATHEEVRQILGDAPRIEISSADHGVAGVERVRAALAAGRPYAVVLVDLRIDGTATIAQMWEVDRDLQVVLCTASAGPGRDAILQRLGASDQLLVLSSPFGLAEVRQLVLAMAEKGRLTRDARTRAAELARSRAELAASVTLARAVQQATADGLMVVDRDRRILTASRRFLEMWNFAPDSLDGRDAAATLHSVLGQMLDPEAVTARVDHLYSHPEESGTDELRLKDGRIMERLTSPVRSDSGEVHGRLWIFRDVTERRRLELDRAVVTERMAAMGRLAAGVGHEINNPLTYALGNIEALLEAGAAQGAQPDGQFAGGFAGGLIERLQEARDGLARIRVIVRDLQTLARADDKVGEVDLKQVIEQAIQIAGAELRHRAPIVRNYRTAPPIHGNQTRLGQVFLNLIINAAQAIPEGQAASNRIEISIRDTSVATVVDVTDTGSGIAPEHLERIFDPFFTTKELGAGTGLGLSISRDIVASHRGTLTARSAPGAGTTMTVTLPHTQRIPRTSTAPPAPAPVARRARVLVIDDEPLIARILQRALSRHQVTVASEARDALARIARGETYDVILCDLMMPDLSGIDVHEHLTREHPAVARRLVFMTGGAFTSKAREFLSTVKNDRLDKPFSLSQVHKVVDRHLATPA